MDAIALFEEAKAAYAAKLKEVDELRAEKDQAIAKYATGKTELADAAGLMHGLEGEAKRKQLEARTAADKAAADG